MPFWTNRKYPSRKYKGGYRFPKWGREFILHCVEKTHTISFESHEIAKELGWKIHKPRRKK